MKSVHRFVFAALLISGALAFAQQQQPALGDVVRQQKPTKKATRVITNEDIPSRPQPDVASVPSAAKTVAPAEAAKAGEAPAQEQGAAKAEKQEKPDSAEVLAMKERLKALDGDEADLQKSMARAEDLAKSEEDATRREVFEHIVAKKRESLERAKAERGEINQKLEERKKAEEK